MSADIYDHEPRGWFNAESGEWDSAEPDIAQFGKDGERIVEFDEDDPTRP